MLFLGVDIAKAKFDIALLDERGKYKTKVLKNNQAGFQQLEKWLIAKKCEKDSLHICMEATGVYGDALARFLACNGYKISVINPAKIKGFAQSELSRNKTDKADAKLIARYCKAFQPPVWEPEPEYVYELRAFVNRLESLNKLRQQEANRQKTAAQVIQESLATVLQTLDAEIEEVERKISDHIDHHPDLKKKNDLLNTIPGIGKLTSAKMLGLFGDISRFDHAKQAAAFAGLNPRQCQSGSSLNKKSRLSKTGHSSLRKALFMPAMVAKRYNPAMRRFATRLKNAGKSKMCILGAIMRKLVHTVYGILKSGKPFDERMAVAP